MQRYPSITVYDVDAQGRLKLKTTGIRLYAISAANPTPVLGPDDGDLYYNTLLKEWMYFDSFRTKWLSISSRNLNAGRPGNTGGNQWFRCSGRVTMSSTIGLPVLDSTLTSISLSRTNSLSSVLEIYNNGSLVGTLASSISGIVTNSNLDIDISSGIISFKNQAGSSNIQNGTIEVILHRRL